MATETKTPDYLRRHKVRFWGRNYIITPRLVEWMHGDGKQFMYFMPLNTRPNYYVVRVDSALSLDNHEENNFTDAVLDDLYTEIEEQFGRSCEEWTADNGRTYTRRNPFPALNDDCGSCWGLLEVSANGNA
jgi:hypothetical protein